VNWLVEGRTGGQKEEPQLKAIDTLGTHYQSTAVDTELSHQNHTKLSQ